MTDGDRMTAWQKSLIIRPASERPCTMSAVDTDGNPMECRGHAGHPGYHTGSHGTVWGHTESWERTPVKRAERPNYLRITDPVTGMRHGIIRYYNDRSPHSAGCRWCGVIRTFHHGGGALPGRPHEYTVPTVAQIKLRMLARRRHRKAY